MGPGGLGGGDPLTFSAYAWQLDLPTLIKVLQGLPRGKAAGSSGMTHDWLRPILKDNVALNFLLQFLNRMLKGFPDLPQEAIHEIIMILGSANLVALLKDTPRPDGLVEAVRPLAVGDILRRLAAKSALKMTREAMISRLSFVMLRWEWG